MKTILILLALVFCLTACGDKTEKEIHTSTTGTFSSDDFRADVSDDKIEIYLLTDDGTALYWSGTWKLDETRVLSIADKAALESSLMGSTAPEKAFDIGDDSIGFEFQAMGMTKNVRLTK